MDAQRLNTRGGGGSVWAWVGSSVGVGDKQWHDEGSVAKQQGGAWWRAISYILLRQTEPEKNKKGDSCADKPCSMRLEAAVYFGGQKRSRGRGREAESLSLCRDGEALTMHCCECREVLGI